MVADVLSQAAADGKRDGGTDKGGKARDSPRRLLKEGKREATLTSALLCLAKQALGRRAKGPKGTDHEDNKAAARRETVSTAVVVLQAAALFRQVRRAPRAVRVVRLEVSAARNVQGLDVHKDPRVGPVEAAEHEVRTVLEASPGGGAPVVKGLAAAFALSKDAVSAQEAVKAGSCGLDSRVVTGGGQAATVRAVDGVAAGGGDDEGSGVALGAREADNVLTWA